jgi:hypothetical protein
VTVVHLPKITTCGFDTADVELANKIAPARTAHPAFIMQA